MLKKKIWVNFERIIELFTQKFVTKLTKIWVWDLGSGTRIRDPGSGTRIRDPGSEIRDPRSGIRDPGSEIRDPRTEIREKPIPDPGSRGQKGTGSRIRIRNTGSIIIVFCASLTYGLLIEGRRTSSGVDVGVCGSVQIPRQLLLEAQPVRHFFADTRHE